MLEIRVKGRFNINFTLRSRISILTGNSGTGKTFMGRYLNDRSFRKEIITNPQGYSFVYVDNIRTLRGTEEKAVILLDKTEQWSVEEYREAMSIVYRGDARYYLIAERGCLWQVLAPSDFYTLEYDNKTFTLKDVYNV